MNYSIQEYEEGKLVRYYTLLGDNKGISETDDFFERMEKLIDLSDELERFVEWMFIVADELGVTSETFREERACSALPPARAIIKDTILFRLYCYIVSPEVVILFNGDRKTEGINKAENCPNVKPHFLKGQNWARQLNQASIETDDKEIIGIEYIIL